MSHHASKPSVIQRIVAWLAAVTAVPVGHPNDGVTSPVFGGAPSGPGTPLDRTWGEQYANLADSLEAWRTNPLAKRLISLITAYVIGDGIRMTSTYKPLDNFITNLFAHPLNNLELELPEWCDELSRSGELFLTLHTNPADGMSYVRAIPACSIDKIEWADNDYKQELRYHEVGGLGDIEGRWWQSPQSLQSLQSPVMLHYAVNRPVGAIRGIGDLDPILPWLRRYTRWLEDRVRLNAGARAFLWVVKVAKNLKSSIEEKYRTPPEPGSLIIAEKDAEEWTAVAPTLHAIDAAADGKAIRWMIAAGGPGTTLGDLGEGESEGLKAGRDASELRHRFLLRRQRYLVYILSDLILHAYNRHRLVIRSHRKECTFADLVAHTPDLSPADNQKLAGAAQALTGSLAGQKAIVGDSEQFRRMALRLYTKFLEEDLSDEDFEAVITQGAQSAITTHQTSTQSSESDLDSRIGMISHDYQENPLIKKIKVENQGGRFAPGDRSDHDQTQPANHALQPAIAISTNGAGKH
jgi:hypothetical protein